MNTAGRIVVIGAGIGGLAAALRLAHSGCEVTVIERAARTGGKLRALPSSAGPVDAGPTVLTLRPVFEALFADTGERLSDHVTLEAEPVLARHYWPDGTRFDLLADPEARAGEVRRTFGGRAARQVRAFTDHAARLFDGFDAPVMQSPAPDPVSITALVARQPRLAAALLPPRTLSQDLARRFAEPKLAQLFGRYATYVGGAPDETPALLALVWSAEARGVWRVEGGMHKLAAAIEALARARGATFLCDTEVEALEMQDGRVTGVRAGGAHHAADAVLFNGDPAALPAGLLGHGVRRAVPDEAIAPRSLSAVVHTFAARAEGPELAHHNVFFGADPGDEFGPLAAGRMPVDPTLYVCAQDRGTGRPAPDGAERFEIIMNAPPTGPRSQLEKTECQTRVLDGLARFGLTFSPAPGPQNVTMPQDFAALFPGSAGALYGRSPHGTMAAFARPTARSAIPGLYLVGGGTTPGAGLPMATLSARHAAAAILRDLPSTSASRPAAMPGGMSTGSASTGPAPSRSSGS